jgi:spermidine synthase
VALISLLFFLSGLSGLIYQVVWVREFGNLFGNTVYSASLIIAVFMLGLGVGSYVVGTWADRQDAARPESLLRTYGLFEVVIGLIGLAISAFLPHLGYVSALASSYSRDANGWYVLSASSYAARVAIAALLLTPITLLMGGTLTLLIRYSVRLDLEIGAWRIALLYGVNTAGAAAGAFLTDFVLVPAVGLQVTQWTAVLCNIAVGSCAFLLASRPSPGFTNGMSRLQPAAGFGLQKGNPGHDTSSSALAWTSLALALSGFAAMGMEILWFRHFTLLLGGFRAVFSLLLTVILIGIGVGSVVGGLLNRLIARPVQWLMVGEGLFVAATLFGLANADLRSILTVDAFLAGLAATPGDESGWARRTWELWLMARPILLEIGVPALVMGFTFPLANAVVQHAERAVGRRAGVLYFSNTIGAVCGSLAAGFLLLPMVGIQGSATVLTIAAGLTVIPLYVATRTGPDRAPAAPRGSIAAPVASTLIGGFAIALWLLLPSSFVITRAQIAPAEGQRQLDLVEGINEVVSVVEVASTGRMLLTNGHAMSSTTLMSQRYMRALAHIPLLSIDHPETALVIGFGVGNTTHAVTLHPSIRRVEVADLSRQVLAHAGYFSDANGDVLNDRRVVVYVNDGRQHLRMRREAAYDLIALEPPPIALAGVGALYSKEFYALARTRLKMKGYISQWLPAYQVPAETTLAMIRAFVDVFPQAVLLCGSNQELLLVGANDSRIEIDPNHLAIALADAPAVRSDLQRLGLGSVAEIVGTFVGSPQTLRDASRDHAPVTDDRPIQEYGARSRLSSGYQRLPASIFDLSQAAVWCPKCFVGAKPVPLAAGLDVYLAVLARVYRRASLATEGPGSFVDPPTRRLKQSSAYPGPVLGNVHDALGVALAAEGKFDEAVQEFREELRRDPNSAESHNDLGMALDSLGKLDEATEQFQQALALRPDFAEARHNLAAATATRGGHRQSGP